MASRTPPVVVEAVNLAFQRLACHGYQSLDLFQRTVVCVWGACGEIDNGGFEQFFFNTSGDWSLDTPAALRRIGALSLARLVDEAIGEFPPPGPSTDLEVRRQQLDVLPVQGQIRLKSLSSQFDTRSVDSLLEAFLNARNE